MFGDEMSDQQLWEMLRWANDPGNYHPDQDPWGFYSDRADSRPTFDGWLYWNWNEADVILASTPYRLAGNA